MTVKDLHAVWGGPPLPSHLMDNLREWERLHPDWVHHLWADEDLDWLEHRDLYDAAPELVPADAVWQFRSDIARYEILHKFGGLYVDCDMLPLRPFDDVLAGHDAWAGMEDRNWVGNAILYAERGHPVLVDLLAGLRENIAVESRKGSRPNRLTGPRYLTPAWRRHGCETAPARLVYPYSYTDVKAGTVPLSFDYDVLCVHEWQHTRDLLEVRRARSPRRSPAR